MKTQRLSVKNPDHLLGHQIPSRSVCHEIPPSSPRLQLSIFLVLPWMAGHKFRRSIKMLC